MLILAVQWIASAQRSFRLGECPPMGAYTTAHLLLGPLYVPACDSWGFSDLEYLA